MKKSMAKVKPITKPKAQLIIDLIFAGICLAILLIKQDATENENDYFYGWRIYKWWTIFANQVKTVFPGAANIYLSLYICKPLVVGFICHFILDVKWKRVYYCQTVFTVRILYNLVISSFIFNGFNLEGIKEELRRQSVHLDVLQFALVLLPITLMELIIYYKSIKPNHKRINKILFRKISQRIVKEEQN